MKFVKFTVASIFCVLAASSSALAVEIKILSVGTMSSVLHDLIPVYERQSGNKVQVTFGNPVVTLERLKKGEPADVVMETTSLWKQAEQLGVFRLETKIALPSSPFAIGIKTGLSGPVTVDNFPRIVEQAKSIALVDRSPSTAFLMKSLEKLGLASQLEAKTKIYPTGGAIAEALVHGEVDAGITTMSELVTVRDSAVLEVLPDDILPSKARTTAAITKSSPIPEEAAAFMQFLTSPASMAVFKAKGFEIN